MSRIAVAMFLAIAASRAEACGACDEDKIAATYDHATVQRAAARHQQVVFCEVQGATYDAGRLRRAAARTSAVDPASVRTSADAAAFSFVVDPRKRSAQSAAAALQRDAPPGTRIAIVRVVGGS